MKKWLISSICFISFCVPSVINATNMVNEAEIDEEYLSQLRELERTKREHLDTLELRDKIKHELIANIQAAGDQELTAKIETIGRFYVASYESFDSFTFRLQERHLLRREIEDCEYILLNKYVKLFDDILAGDSQWELIKEQMRNMSLSKILGSFLNGYHYEGYTPCINPIELLKSNPATRDTLDKMYEEFADWTDSKLGDLRNKLKIDQEKFEAFKWACLSEDIPHISHQSVPSATNFSLEYNPSLRKALERHCELKEQVEILDRIYVEEKLADIREKAISNKIGCYLRRREASKRAKLEQEVYDSSRALTQDELKNVAPLMSMIAKKHGISDVRIIDAESLITSMHLPVQEKQQLLSLLKHGSQEEVDAEIQQFLNESEFLDITLPHSLIRYSNIRNDVANALFWGAHDSPVYRDQILTLIAWSRATEPALYDTSRYGLSTDLDYKKRRINFNATSEGSSAGYNNINMNFSEVLYLNGISQDTCNHMDAFFSPNRRIIFHEIGHVISGNIGYVVDTVAPSRQKTMDIASESIIRRKDESIVAENMAFLRSLPADEIEQLRKGISLIFSKMDIRGLSLETSDKAEFLEIIERLYTSDSLFSNVVLVQNTTELMQILGLFSHTYKGNHILYINKLSDATASAFAKQPIRVDHGSEDSNETDSSDVTVSDLEILGLFKNITGKLKPAVKEEVNLAFYKVLVSAFGLDANEYFDRDNTTIAPMLLF